MVTVFFYYFWQIQRARSPGKMRGNWRTANRKLSTALGCYTAPSSLFSLICEIRVFGARECLIPRGSLVGMPAQSRLRCGVQRREAFPGREAPIGRKAAGPREPTEQTPLYHRRPCFWLNVWVMARNLLTASKPSVCHFVYCLLIVCWLFVHICLPPHYDSVDKLRSHIVVKLRTLYIQQEPCNTGSRTGADNEKLPWYLAAFIKVTRGATHAAPSDYAYLQIWSPIIS